MRKFLLIALTLIASACANNPAANLSPEGKAAFFGNQFLESVERAQAQTIALVGTNGVTRADVTPAVEGFVKIGQGGQQFAQALRAIDASNVTTADKQAAAVRAHNALIAFEGVINSLTVNVIKPELRTKIDGIIKSLQLAVSLFDVMQYITPFLPKTAAPVKVISFNGGLIYGTV
jgi:hypothetical protein